MNWRRVFLILSIALVCIGVVFVADTKAAEPSPQDLVRSVQSELKRVGCFAGSIDGNWNAASQRSLDMFNKRAGTKFDVKLASIDVLHAIRAETSRICPEADAKTAMEAAELARQAKIVQKGSQQSAIAPIQAQPQSRCVTFPQNSDPEAELRYLLSHPDTRVCPSRNPDLSGQRDALAQISRDRVNNTSAQICAMNGHGCGDLAVEPHKEASVSEKPAPPAEPGSRPTLPSGPPITADAGGVAIENGSPIIAAPRPPSMPSDVPQEPKIESQGDQSHIIGPPDAHRAALAEDARGAEEALPRPNQITADAGGVAIGDNGKSVVVIGGNQHPDLQLAQSKGAKPGQLITGAAGKVALGSGNVTSSTIDPGVDPCRERLRRLGINVLSGPCVDVGEIVDNLARGTYSFNKPKAVNLGEAFPVRLVLQTGAGQAVSFAGLPGNVERREDKPFAQSVEATLSGDDFEITPAGPQGRTATFAQPVEWDWKLQPTSAGTKSLTIEVAANIFVGADKHRVQITTLHESIQIEVTILQRLKAYVADASGLIVATAALATPLAVLIGFVPKVRKFFQDEMSRFWRRRNRRVKRNHRQFG